MSEPDNGKLGTVRIAPSVLATIASLTARNVGGVAGMSPLSRPSGRVLARANTGHAPGVALTVRNAAVTADVYIVAQPETNLHELGRSVQSRVREALDLMVGMPAEQVNVFIEDVSE